MSATHGFSPRATVLPSKRYNPEYRWEEITEGWRRPNLLTNEHAFQSLSAQLTLRIPLDVYEHIMDHMDQKCLYYAALVCHAWHSHSICLLYRIIEIQQRSAFSTLSHKSPAARARLKASRELRVMHRKGPAFCHAIPPTLGRAMPAVERLVFHACIQPLMHPAFARYLSSFAGVKELEMSEFKFSSVAEMGRVLHAFPRLAHLSLSHGEVAQEARSQSDVDQTVLPTTHVGGPQKLRLQTLMLGMQLGIPVLEALVDWLTVPPPCQSMSHVECWRDSLEGVPSVNRLLETVGGALLDLSEHQGHFEKDAHVDLSHNHNLRCLEFTASRRLTETSGIRWAELTNELMSVLSSVRSMNMQRILVHIVFRTITQVGHMLPLAASETGRPALHNILERPNYDLLDEVQVTIEVDATDIAWSPDKNRALAEDKACQIVPYIRDLFAPWHERGILTVTPIYWNLCPSYGEVNSSKYSSASGLLYAHQKAFYHPTYLPLGLLNPQDAKPPDSNTAGLLYAYYQRDLYQPAYLPLGILQP